MDLNCEDLNIHKSLQETVAELTKPGKILAQLNGWRNVCQTLEYICRHSFSLLDYFSGLAFDQEGLSQVVGYVSTARMIKEKVLLGAMFKTSSAMYKLDSDRSAELIEGFDGLDRTLKKLSIWGCDFVILQAKLGCNKLFGARQVPFENCEYFGIFSVTAQCLGMVPIIQIQYDLLGCSEEDCAKAFVDTMYKINLSLYDFEVDISCLLISPLISYSLEMVKGGERLKAENLINTLKHSLPPAIGGVVFSSEGSYKALGLQFDQLSKIISRIPWPITCGYQWKVPAIIPTDSKNLSLEKWVKKQALIIQVLSLAAEGNLIAWNGKPSVGMPEFITTHDYYDKEYEVAMLGQR